MTQEEFDRLQARNSKTPGRLVASPKVTACHLWQQNECACTGISGCQKLDADPVPIKPLPHVFRSGRSKYKNVKTGKYASRKEAKRAATLQLLEAAGNISRLVASAWGGEYAKQCTYLLIPPQKGADGKSLERACRYIADFKYFDANGASVVEDCKGHLTDVYRLKRKLMLFVHGITILET